MKTLVYYEKRKILRRKSTVIACLFMLLSILALSLVFVSDQGYFGADGTELSGHAAISAKRENERLLAGQLTPDYLTDILQRCQTTYNTAENYDSMTGGLRDDVYLKQILPYREILNLMLGVYAPDTYDLRVLTTVTDGDFYNVRHANIQAVLDSGSYTSAEKDTVLKKDAMVSIPFTFDYANGWDTLLTRAFSTLFLLISIAVCVAISPIFANEYQTGADSIILASKYGRRETVHAKIFAAFVVTSSIYAAAVLFCMITVLLPFGMQGWNCNFQILSVNSFYNMKIWQVVLCGIIINYIVVLEVMAFTMLMSAICKTSFAAVIISVVCTLIPMFIPTGNSKLFTHIVNLLPARAVETYSVFSPYDLYSVGKLVFTLPYMIMIVACVWILVALPTAHRKFCRHQVA